MVSVGDALTYKTKSQEQMTQSLASIKKTIKQILRLKFTVTEMVEKIVMKVHNSGSSKY